MKGPSDHLFKLIKSLTKSEKRYFTSQARSGKKGEKYLAIFHAIDAQSEYDEALIKRRFQAYPWIDRFNSAKEYLQKAMMEDLISYNRQNESQYSLDSLLLSIKILQKKGFYPECLKMIKKGKVLARELDDLKQLLALLELQSLNHPGGINPHGAEEILKEQKNAIHLLQNEYEYDLLYKLSYQILLESGLDNLKQENLKKYLLVIENPLLKMYNQALTFNSQRQFINIHYFYCRGVRKFDEMHDWILKANSLFKNKQRIILKYPLNYATTLLNLEASLEKRGEYNEALTVLKILRSFYPRHLLKKQDRLTFIVDYASLHHELTLLCKIGEFTEANDKLSSFLELGNIHNREFSEDIALQHQYLLAEIYFCNERPTECKEQLERIISLSNTDIRRDIHKKARLLLSMVYFEGGHIDLYDSSLRSSQRFLERHKIFDDSDQVCFKILRLGLNMFENKPDVQKLLQKLEQSPQGHPFFSAWVKSKTMIRPLAEMVKAEYQ
ncbi:MAG: tetratricopeptide (TPR) repeat protein [Arenicella sp.]|jgi:tetratricopeptide (TPR) repeat protein